MSFVWCGHIRFYRFQWDAWQYAAAPFGQLTVVVVQVMHDEYEYVHVCWSANVVNTTWPVFKNTKIHNGHFFEPDSIFSQIALIAFQRPPVHLEVLRHLFFICRARIHNCFHLGTEHFFSKSFYLRFTLISVVDTIRCFNSQALRRCRVEKFNAPRTPLKLCANRPTGSASPVKRFVSIALCNVCQHVSEMTAPLSVITW